MSVPITIGGVIYNNPSQNDPPPWGQTLQSIITALAAAVASNPSFMVISTVAATPTTLASGTTYLVNSASLAITLNVPQPAVNSWFMVKDIGYNALANNITIHRFAAEKIENVAQDMTIAQNGGAWMFVSDGTNWFALTMSGVWQ